MTEIESGDDKELIFFAILFMLNILCDVFHDVIDNHVYVRQISRAMKQFQKRLMLQLLQRRVAWTY